MERNEVVDILREAGYGVVEGKEAVLAKIEELSDNRSSISNRMPRNRPEMAADAFKL